MTKTYDEPPRPGETWIDAAIRQLRDVRILRQMFAGRGDAAAIGAESAGEPSKAAELLTSSAPDSNGQLSEIIQEIKDNNRKIREIIELQHAVLLKFLQPKTEKKQ